MSRAAGPATSNPGVIRIKPYHYIHVLDNNSNVTFVLNGPQTFTRLEHQILLVGPEPMINIPPRHYCIISNPVVKDEDGKPVTDTHGQYRLRHGDQEIRFEQAPFALYPGEKVEQAVTELTVVPPNTALRLRALRDVSGHKAGDEWLFEGPGTYTPRVEVKVVEQVRSILIHPNQALRLRARKATKDRNDNARKAGEEWLVRDSGAYLPGVDEEIVGTVGAVVLTDKTALHLRANRTFTDVFGKERKAGEEWLVTIQEAETHIPDVYEEVVGQVSVTILNNRQYCVVLDPMDSRGRLQLGQREVRKGELVFFLRPGERLESGIQDVFILSDDEALLLRAREAFDETVEVTDENGTRTKADVSRRPGDRWMIYGPVDFVPSVQVEVVERRRAIPLDENEGIYVRDIRSGKVRMVQGESYMLLPNEELWEKDLPKVVEELLGVDALADRGRGNDSSRSAARDKSRVVTYRVPHNAAAQIYDYKEKQARVVFGPDLVMLGPDEHFTVLSLSGGKPKKPNTIRSLCLLMGPDFMTDIVKVETSDHARLQLQLSYNWEFDINRSDAEQAYNLFQVPDFVGDACKAIASKIRGAVASTPFDEFHRHSARIIRVAIFGEDENHRIKPHFIFESNNLKVTNIDIQSVEPVDQRTRDSLQKSVQLAIEITTKSQEASARHEAERTEQEARGKLERQRIKDEALAEQEREKLLKLNAKSTEVESTGRAASEAKARAASRDIEGQTSVEVARLKAQASEIESQEELSQLRARQEADIAHQKRMIELEIEKARTLSKIESKKFSSIVTSIGAETIEAMASAGPELQAKLLQGLGLKGYILTNGNNPINLFGAANGLLGRSNNGGLGAVDDAASTIASDA